MNFCYCFCICVGVKLQLFGRVVYCCCNIHYFFVIIIMYHYHGKAALHDDLSMICRWSVAVIWLVGMLLYISIYNMPYVTVVTFIIFFLILSSWIVVTAERLYVTLCWSVDPSKVTLSVSPLVGQWPLC